MGKLIVRSGVLVLSVLMITSGLSHAADDAVKHFNKALFSLSQSFSLGHPAEVMSPNIENALSEFRYVVENYPESKWAPASQNHIAWMYFDRRELDKAAVEFERSFTLFPDSIFADDGQFELGYIHFLKKGYDSAIVDFQKVIDTYSKLTDPKKNDRVPYAYFMIAECKLKQGKTAEAITWYQKLIDLFSNHEKSKEAENKISSLK